LSAAGRTACYVGIDVSKATLEVAILPTGECLAASNDEAGIDELVGKLAELPEALVLLEATGGFERPVAAAIIAACGIAIFVVNPRQARDFAKATGRLAKTDALDALVLARFAQAIRPTPRTIPDQEAREFGEIFARRRQIVRMLTAEKNRPGAIAAPRPYAGV
jgi:transposase